MRTHIAATLALTGALTLTGAALAEKGDADWIEARVRQWQPTETEQRWKQVAWAPSIREAVSLAQKHQRPIFLFTLDGRMEVGRC